MNATTYKLVLRS